VVCINSEIAEVLGIYQESIKFGNNPKITIGMMIIKTKMICGNFRSESVGVLKLSPKIMFNIR